VAPDPANLSRISLIYYAALTREEEGMGGPTDQQA
jgi:hypothetical protein